MIRVKSSTATLKISQVDEEIFRRRYFARCLECHFCDDGCCNYGCTVDRAEVEQILSYRLGLEPMLKVPVAGWFQEGMTRNVNYPSGETTRTVVYHDKCVFYSADSRGCLLERFAQGEGLDPHQLKPIVCCLFPLRWQQGCLFVSNFLDELPCNGQGISVFQAQKSELRARLGADFVAELEAAALIGN